MVAANVQEARRRLAKHYVEAVSEFQAMYLLGGDNIMRAVAAFAVEREQLESWFDWLVKKAQDDTEAAMLILHLLKNSHFLLNRQMNWRDLRVWYEQGLSLVQQHGDPAAEAVILMTLGTCALENGEPDKSEDLIRRASDRARAAGDSGILGKCVKLLGILLETVGRYEESHGALVESLDLLRQADLPRDLAGALWELGWNASMSNEVAQAERYNQEAYDLIYRNGDYNLLAHGHYMFGVTAYFKGEFAQSVAHYREALEYVQLAKNQRTQLNILLVAANTYDKLGDYAASDAHNLQALQLAMQMGAERMIAAALGNLGNTKLAQGDFRAARGYHEQALVLFQQFKMERQITEVLGTLSNIYANLELYADAAAALRDSFTFAERLAQQPQQSQVLTDAAYLWLQRAVKLGDLQYLESALRCYGLTATDEDTDAVSAQIRQVLPEVEALIGAERVALLIAEGAQRELADLFSEVKLLVADSA